MEIQLIAYTNGINGESPEKLIELAARTSYKSFSKMEKGSEKKLIRHLINLGHLSVLEHVSATFKIEGISRVCSHQLVRHRLASFTQESQRYVLQEGREYVIPFEIKKSELAKQLFEKIVNLSYDYYEELIKLGIRKEDARFVLSQAVTTSLVMTANFREWWHIISLRVSEEAQWEIRALMTKIWRDLYRIAPTVFDVESFKREDDYEYKKEIFESIES